MTKPTPEQIARYADMFGALANDARLRILRLLLAAHPTGIIAGDIQAELGIPNSTLSHHLEKLRSEDLARVRRDGSFLWYTANTEALQEILNFLYAECCTRNPPNGNQRRSAKGRASRAATLDRNSAASSGVGRPVLRDFISSEREVRPGCPPRPR